MPQYVYLLVSTSGATYVGATVDLDHRLRQHNKEIKGGAVATSIKVLRGETWHRHCYVAGFPTWQSALQFEWRWKQIHRKLPKSRNITPLDNRMKALDILLALDRPTSKAMLYSEWTLPPKVVIESMHKREEEQKQEQKREQKQEQEDIMDVVVVGESDM